MIKHKGRTYVEKKVELFLVDYEILEGIPSDSAKFALLAGELLPRQAFALSEDLAKCRNQMVCPDDQEKQNHLKVKKHSCAALPLHRYRIECEESSHRFETKTVLKAPFAREHGLCLHFSHCFAYSQPVKAIKFQGALLFENFDSK